ncbi:MAG: hypothetical protein ACE3L7_12015 [Candidatus Pristimantibacillus sp.]
MKAKWFIAALAMGMLLLAVPAYAAQPEEKQPAVKGQTDHSKDWKYGIRKEHMSGADFEKHRLEKLRYMAEYFGIKTEGKTADQLKTELQAAKQKDKAKWEAFKTEQQAKRLEHLRKIAAEQGIATEGKSAEQLRDELHKLHGSDGQHRHRAHGHKYPDDSKQDMKQDKNENKS